jgi:DNA-binding NtrC family response regulator
MTRKTMLDGVLSATRILVVSRESSALGPLREIGEASAWQLETAESGWEALERIQSGPVPDLVLLDLPRDDADGLHTLRCFRKAQPDLPILLLSHPDDSGQSTEAIRLGAQDCLVRPFEEKQLEMAINRHLESRNDRSDSETTSDHIEHISDHTFFVAASPLMRKLRAEVELLAQVNVPLFIVGEEGSGKETVARLIHKRSVRSGFRFLKVNCAALPGDLLESELFGYERSFVPGARTKPGMFDLCEKGTLYLDAITEMPISLQAKLLQVLQERHFCRLGGDTKIPVEARMIAATNVDFERALAERKLRQDLYCRLSALTVHVPPLRQRKDEIPLLLGHFMNQLARHYGLPARTFSPLLLDACQSYFWPGNLQELEDFVKRYLVVGDQDAALSELGRDGDSRSHHVLSLPGLETAGGHGGHSCEGGESDGRSSGLKSLVQSVKGEAERNAIATALEQTRWNRKAAARLLKVSYRTLLYKIQQYHMSPPEYASSFSSGYGTKNNGYGYKDHSSSESSPANATLRSKP